MSSVLHMERDSQNATEGQRGLWKQRNAERVAPAAGSSAQPLRHTFPFQLLMHLLVSMLMVFAVLQLNMYVRNPRYEASRLGGHAFCSV